MLKRLYAAFVYYPTLWWNVLQGRVTRRWQWWTVLEPTLILGAVPFRSDVKQLADLGVRGVVNTCSEFPGHLDLYEQAGIEQFWMPTVDFTPPHLKDVRAAVDFIERKTAAGQPVYVHCKAGRARSATVVVCYLMKKYGWSADEAQLWVRQRRPQILKKVAQRQVVQDFAAEMKQSYQSDSASLPARTQSAATPSPPTPLPQRGEGRL